MAYKSLLNYYQESSINPVPIDLGDRDAWESHLDKRRNLYERHLGIPMSFLKGRSVLEFGCNSGENALALAHFGANLTLVEPNDQVYPRLKELFARYGYEDRIVELSGKDINSFDSDRKFDLVLAEGFINQLSDREKAVGSILELTATDGLAVISFDCKYGHFLEMIRKLLYWRSCELASVDATDPGSLGIATALFLDDFKRLNVSRPFEAWWQDVLLNPFCAWDYLWSYQELIPIAEAASGEFLSSSPRWAPLDDFVWYKNTPSTGDRHRALLNEWSSRFTYFLTGLQTQTHQASGAVVESVSTLVRSVSTYVDNGVLEFEYPVALDRFLVGNNDQGVSLYNEDLKSIFSAVVRADNQEDLVASYHQSHILRGLWGAPYHYVSFRKSSASPGAS